LSGRGLCDELITRPEESYRLCCVFVCDLETSRLGAPYIYGISRLRVNIKSAHYPHWDYLWLTLLYETRSIINRQVFVTGSRVCIIWWGSSYRMFPVYSHFFGFHIL